MRIIGGTFKGRKFFPPADSWPTRPTTDFAKEGLFNILANRIDFADVKVLDLFGGTGNHGYEFISRGCQSVTYVDRFGPAIRFVKKTSTELGISDRMQLVRSDVFKYLKRATETFDYIFAGPPYGMPRLDSLPNHVMAGNLLAPDGLFVLEHNPKHDFREHPAFCELRTYGQTHFSFFQHPESSPS